MISAENYALNRKSDFFGKSFAKRHEVSRFHARVTAVLVNLIRRRFDK